LFGWRVKRQTPSSYPLKNWNEDAPAAVGKTQVSAILNGRRKGGKEKIKNKEINDGKNSKNTTDGHTPTEDH
jgi:hypothetical protein